MSVPLPKLQDRYRHRYRKVKAIDSDADAAEFQVDSLFFAAVTRGGLA